MDSGYEELEDGACWWCGSPADSREHKLKRSDLVREYGRPPYAGHADLLLGFHQAAVRFTLCRTGASVATQS
jgi:hypothetical protein